MEDKLFRKVLNDIYIYIYIHIHIYIYIYSKKIFYLNEKTKDTIKIISCGIQIYFDWIKTYFDIMKKGEYNENIFY